MKIKWNKENSTITVGKAIFNSYRMFKNRESWVNYVLRENGYHERAYKDKLQNKVVSDMLGCSSVTLYKMFNSLQLKVFVAPVYEIIKKVGFSKRGFDPDVVSKVNSHKNKLTLAYEDGLYNLLPIIASTGKSPQELKAEYKGIWKKVSKNSLRKNCAIVKHKKEVWGEDIPTTLLLHKGLRYCTKETFEYLRNNFKGSWKDSSKMQTEALYFGETLRMASGLGLVVNPSWSKRRLKEEHDKMSHEITTRKYSTDVLDSCNKVWLQEYEYKGYKAKLLNSAFLVADEGKVMGHCVGLYADSVREGSYLVYSITKDGERSSTVGISRYIKEVPDKKFYEVKHIFNQQYGKFNSVVTCEDEKYVGNKLVEILDKGEINV